MTDAPTDRAPETGEPHETHLVSITTRFPDRSSAEALVEQERATFDRLVADGSVIGGFLATDWHAVWIVVRAPSVEAAKAIVMQLPMSRWFHFEDIAPVHRIPASQEQGS